MSTGSTAHALAERIKEQLRRDGVAWQASFTDDFTMGDPTTSVTGIAVTFKPTLSVLERAAGLGLNMIISHEAAFWEAFDPSQVMRGDPVRRAKQAFVRDQGLVVWRIHDHLHRMQPDPVFVGLLRKLAWTSFFDGDLEHIEIPEIRLDRLAAQMQDRLETDNVSVVGDPAQPVRSVGFGIHVLSTILPALRASDVAIVGETGEYDTFEYMRDALALDQHKGLIRIGHERLEEWGIENFADWLQACVRELPVEWISTGEPFAVPDV